MYIIWSSHMEDIFVIGLSLFWTSNFWTGKFHLYSSLLTTINFDNHNCIKRLELKYKLRKHNKLKLQETKFVILLFFRIVWKTITPPTIGETVNFLCYIVSLFSSRWHTNILNVEKYKRRLSCYFKMLLIWLMRWQNTYISR